MVLSFLGLILFLQTSLVGQFQEGDRLLTEGNLAGAEQRFTAVLEEKPDFVAAQKGLAKIRVKQNRIDDAIWILERIKSRDECDLDARLTLAELYSWARKYDRSIVEYKDVISLDTMNVAALKRLGRVLRWATRYRESEESYALVLALEPDDPEALSGLALTYAQQKRMDEALGLIDRALKQSPDNVEILKTRADILAWSNRYQEAEKGYLDLLPKTAHRAEIYHALGDLYAAPRDAAAPCAPTSRGETARRRALPWRSDTCLAARGR